MKYLRYLKKYNESADIDIQEIINNCKDIVLDLTDDGFYFDFLETYTRREHRTIGLTFFKDGIFYMKDIQDYINRLTTYLNSEGFTEGVNVMNGVCYYGTSIIFKNITLESAYYYSLDFENGGWRNYISR